jgi:hypothetical protein
MLSTFHSLLAYFNSSTPTSTQPELTSATTMPQLDPAILLLIAQHVKRPIPILFTGDHNDEKVINADKTTLLNMMKTSKVSHHLMEPE